MSSNLFILIDATSLKYGEKRMGYFDGLVDGIFKKDFTGNTLFYPWGILGTGFIIESDKRRNQIRRSLKNILIIAIPLGIVSQALMGIWLSLILWLIFVAGYYFYINKITQGLPKTTEKLKITEAYGNSAKSHNLTMLILLEICSLVFVFAGFWLLYMKSELLLAFASIVFFGVGSIVFGYMLFIKIRSN